MKYLFVLLTFIYISTLSTSFAHANSCQNYFKQNWVHSIQNYSRTVYKTSGARILVKDASPTPKTLRLGMFRLDETVTQPGWTKKFRRGFHYLPRKAFLVKDNQYIFTPFSALIDPITELPIRWLTKHKKEFTYPVKIPAGVLIISAVLAYPTYKVNELYYEKLAHHNATNYMEQVLAHKDIIQDHITKDFITSTVRESLKNPNLTSQEKTLLLTEASTIVDGVEKVKKTSQKMAQDFISQKRKTLTLTKEEYDDQFAGAVSFQQLDNLLMAENIGDIVSRDYSGFFTFVPEQRMGEFTAKETSQLIQLSWDKNLSYSVIDFLLQNKQLLDPDANWTQGNLLALATGQTQSNRPIPNELIQYYGTILSRILQDKTSQQLIQNYHSGKIDIYKLRYKLHENITFIYEYLSFDLRGATNILITRDANGQAREAAVGLDFFQRAILSN